MPRSRPPQRPLFARRNAEAGEPLDGELRYWELFEANPQPMLVYDLETLKFLAVNEAAVARYGYSREEFATMSILDIRPPEDVPRLLQRIAGLRNEDSRPAGIWRHRRKDGTLIDVEITSSVFDFGGRRTQLVLANDVTDRLQAERKLRESEARFRSLAEMSSDWYWETDSEHRFTLRSSGSKERLVSALLPDARLGLRRWEIPHLAPDEAGWRAHRAVLDAHLLFRDFELSRLGDDGSARYMLISGDPVFDASGGFQGYRGVGTDVTERRRAQMELERRKDLYNLLSQTNQAIVRLGNRDALFPVICRNAVEYGRFVFAWIGAVDAQDGRVRPVAQWGEDAGYVDALRSPRQPSDQARWNGPLGQALRAGEHAVSNDFLNDSRAAVWHEAARRAGVRSAAAFPIREREAVVGALCLYAADPGYFTEDLIATLDEMALDISFGLTVYAREGERTRAVEALHQSEARFRSLTAMSSDFYWESDTEHRLTQRDSANRMLSTVSVFQQGAQIGERRWEIPYLSPDAAGWEAHRAVLDAHLPFRHFELSRPGVDGTERFISISGDPVFDDAGAFKGYRGVGTDITARKREEQLLRLEHAVARSLAESSDQSSALKTVMRSICESNNWGRGTYWRVDEAAGLMRFGEFWNMPGAEFERYTEGSRAVVFERGVGMIGRVWQSGESLWIADFYNDPRVVQKLLAREAGMRSVLAFPVVAAGRTVGALAFFSREARQPDARLLAMTRMIGTEVGQFLQRVQAEDRVRAINAELEARIASRTQQLEIANRELEAFSYSVSHDLRAPLRAIHGFSSLLQEQYAGQIDEQGRDMLRHVRSGAKKMGHLIDDLLKLSRVSRQEIQAEPVDLSEMAWEVIGELQGEAPERKIEWVIASGVSATGDPGLLRVVLQNIIGNAWKYSSRREHARIEFGISQTQGRPAYFVRDNGAGFDMAQAKRLFGAFQRLHSSAEFPGSGIGLATVARILQRHAGKAWAEGRLGEGATFYFSLGSIRQDGE